MNIIKRLALLVSIVLPQLFGQVVNPPFNGSGGGGSGTVTTVGFTGGVISVANPTTTPAFTVAGTSGGIPYFSSSSTWASSGVLGANLPLFGGGAGASPIAGTRSGNTTVVVTTTGTQTSGNCVSIDASGNHVANGAACLSSADLAGTYFNLGSTNAVTAINNTFPSTAAFAGIVIVAGANDVPTAILAGSLNRDLAGRLGDVGPSADYRVFLYVQGSGRNLPTEPTSGYIPIWLSDFKQTFDPDFRFSTDTLFIGTAGTTAGKLQLQNATSGSITVVPVTGALGTITQTLPAFSGTFVVAATSTTATQFLAATTTAGAPAYRAIAAGDLPTTLTSGTAITNAALTTPTLGTPASGTLTNATGLPTAGLVANAVTSAKLAVVNTRRICDIGIGNTNGSAIANGDLGPQKRGCFVPYAATIVEVDVSADAGTPNVIVGRNIAGTQANLLSGALATASSGGIACSNTGGTTGLDGATTCSGTLQNTAIAAGGYLELVSGTAGGTAKWMTVHIVYTVD